MCSRFYLFFSSRQLKIFKKKEVRWLFLLEENLQSIFIFIFFLSICWRKVKKKLFVLWRNFNGLSHVGIFFISNAGCTKVYCSWIYKKIECCMHLNGFIVCLHKMQQCIYLEKKHWMSNVKINIFASCFFLLLLG